PERRGDIDVSAGEFETHCLSLELSTNQARARTSTGARCRSVEHFALVRCGNLQLFAIFRDCPSGQHQAFTLQDADDLRVAQRLSWIFVFDNLTDALLNRD